MDAEWQDRLEEIAVEVAALRRRVAAGGKVLNQTWSRRIERHSSTSPTTSSFARSTCASCSGG
jgi:hypothetical protein